MALKEITISFTLLITKTKSISLYLVSTGGKVTSEDLLNYTPLPQITAEDEEILSANNQYLTGEHDRLVYSYADKQSAYDTSDLDKVIEAGNKKTNLKEIHLLAHLVSAITSESALIPKKSFFINYNDNFIFDEKSYVTRDEVQELNSYVLFARPSQEDIDRYLALKGENDVNLLKKVEVPEFFKVSSDIHENYFYIENLCWPGSVTYTKPGTSYFGFIYFGNGIKRKDIDFLLS